MITTYCTNCGEEVIANSNFCGNCGKPIKVITDINDSKTKPKTKSRLLKQEKRKLLYVLLIVFGVFIIAFYLNNTPSNAVGKYMKYARVSNTGEAMKYLSVDADISSIEVTLRNARYYTRNEIRYEIDSFTIISEEREMGTRQQFLHMLLTKMVE
ncbi:zinc ribbon domain-containing protein [Sporosarcina thermotolerans]|uniref:zinc-ribbon domain-containing protein n=1 Tax=Sporosarcina thermotolerans TaxID=633404 RepID=UPI0024BBF2F2|nr:zinc ribbon domain-containing protein [Sporosarcina thermotolerans]WHT48198.1 zinc ribbon domain-containing protein [Sporosarcina thermotolerans]